MKRLFAILLCMLLIPSCLTGCSQTEAVPDEVPTQPDDRPFAGQELNVWTDYVIGAPICDTVDTYVEKFEEMTGATINISHYGADLGTILYTALENGEDIDVFPTGNVMLSSKRDLTLDLTDRMENSDIRERSYPVLLDLIETAAADGTLRGIPTTSSFNSFWYNNAAFEKAGIKETPETFEEFEDVCDALIAAGYRPIALDSAYAIQYFGTHMERVLGQQTVSDMVLNGGFSKNEAFINACQQLIDWVNKGYFDSAAPAEWPASQNKIGLTEECVMVYAGSWIPGEIEEMTGADLEWGCFKYPRDPNGNGTYGSTVSCSLQCVNTNCETPDLAWEYIYYMYTGEVNKAITDADVILVDDMTMDALPTYEEAKQIMMTTTDVTNYAGGMHDNADIKTSINDLVLEIYAGKFATGADAAAAFDALVG